MIVLPFLGALLEAVVTVVDKKILRKHKIDHRNLTVYGFSTMVLVMLPFIFFFWDVKPGALEFQNIIIFFTVVILSLLAVTTSLYSLKREDVSEIEPIRLIQPLFTILLAFIFSFFFSVYSNERNPLILILALIASIALIASHVEKHHLKMNKYIIAATLGSFFFALELVISRSILELYNPLTFYFLRCMFMFIFALIIFHPSIEPLKKSNIKFLILFGAVSAVIYRMVVYYGFLSLGIVFTTILFIVAPIFVYIFARVFLKEKIRLKQIIASIIIIICIILTILLKGGI